VTGPAHAGKNHTGRSRSSPPSLTSLLDRERGAPRSSLRSRGMSGLAVFDPQAGPRVGGVVRDSSSSSAPGRGRPARNRASVSSRSGRAAGVFTCDDRRGLTSLGRRPGSSRKPGPGHMRRSSSGRGGTWLLARLLDGSFQLGATPVAFARGLRDRRHARARACGSGDKSGGGDHHQAVYMTTREGHKGAFI